LGAQPAEIAGRIADLTGPALEQALQTWCGQDAALRRQVEQIVQARRTFYATWAPEGEPQEEGGSATIEIDLDTPRPERERIGGYRILDILGEGGMGVVFHAEQQHPLRRVALKMVHPERVTPDAKARFHREAQLLGRLLHPGIPQVYEAGEADGRLFLAMELVEGRPITEWARGKDLRSCVTTWMRACEAVHHAHLRGVVHQDIKPANLLVTDEGQPKVLDFGIAATLRREGRVRRSGVAGTPAYMAPEQLVGTGDLDVRVDVYALGVVGYQILTERLPIDVPTTTLEQVREVVERGEVPAASRWNRVLRGDLDAILRRALARRADDRYPSAADLAEDLRRFLAHEPVSARRAGVGYHAWLWVRRHPGPAAGLTFVGLSLLLSVVVLAWAYLDVSAARQAAVVAHSELEVRHQALILLQAASELRVDPARTLDVLAGLHDASHPAAEALRYQAQAAGVPEHRLYAHQGDVRAVLLVPGGAWTAGYDDRVLRWDLGGLEPVVAEEHLHNADVTLLRSGPGGVVASAGRDGAPRLHRAGKTQVLDGHGAEIDLLGFAEDGRLASGDVQGRVRVWDLDGSRAHEHVFGAAVTSGGWHQGRLWVGLADGGLWSWTPGSAPILVFQHPAPVVGVTVVDGVVVSGGEDGSLRFGDRPPIPAHEADLRVVVGGADGRVVTGDRAGRVKIWWAETATELATWDTGGGVIRAAALDGNRLFFGSEDGTVHLWDLDTDLQRSYAGHGARVRDVAASGGVAISGAGDGVARVWSLELRPPSRLVGHRDAVTAVLATEAGWLSASEDGTARLWDPQTGRGTVLSTHHEGVESVLLGDAGPVFGHRGGLVRGPGVEANLGGKVRRLARGADGVLVAALETADLVWWTKTGVQRHPAHAGKVEDLIVGPDGRLWSGGQDGRVVRWDAPGQGTEFLQEEHPISEISFDRAGRLVVGTQEGRVLREGAEIARHQGYVQAILPMEDGRMVTLGADGVVQMDGRPVGRHAGPAVYALQTPDGALWTAGGRGLFRWDPASNLGVEVVVADAPIVGLALRGPHLAFGDGREVRVVPW
jgi:WD40 repeat protein/predicted Ser/Thr protein kinase